MTNNEARKRQASNSRIDVCMHPNRENNGHCPDCGQWLSIVFKPCGLKGCKDLAGARGYCDGCLGANVDGGKVDDGDPVNHPNHYTALGATCTNCGHDIECIDIVKHFGWREGSVIKYVWRADHKGNRRQDLMKARALLDSLIKDCK